MHGTGEIYYKTGAIYKGKFSNGCINGEGLFIFPREHQKYEKYEGQFLGNKFQGKGELLFKDGKKYEGEFNQGQIQGQGIMSQPGKYIYKGGFLNCKKHGNNNEMTFSNGDIYLGSFQDDLLEGKGEYKYANGSVYIGDFHRGKKHGLGMLTIKTPGETFIYKGEFKDDKF